MGFFKTGGYWIDYRVNSHYKQEYIDLDKQVAAKVLAPAEVK
jgi:hypothetical protein